MRRPRGQDVPRAGAAAAVRGADHPAQADEGRELGPAPEELARLERLGRHGAGSFAAGLEAGIVSATDGMKPRDLVKLVRFEPVRRGVVRLVVSLPNLPPEMLEHVVPAAKLRALRTMFRRLGRKMDRAMAAAAKMKRR